MSVDEILKSENGDAGASTAHQRRQKEMFVMGRDLMHGYTLNRIAPPAAAAAPGQACDERRLHKAHAPKSDSQPLTCAPQSCERLVHISQASRSFIWDKI
jgi:hypothetical protein